MLERILGQDVDRKPISTQRWLERQGIRRTDAVQVHLIDQDKIESTEEFLQQHGVGKSAVVTDPLQQAEFKHRLNSRTIILLSLVVPMSIAPFWLMALLSLPAFDKRPYSDAMQAAFLTALVSDFVGLYYVITRDLFPQGKASSNPIQRHSLNGSSKPALTRKEDLEPESGN